MLPDVVLCYLQWLIYTLLSIFLSLWIGVLINLIQAVMGFRVAFSSPHVGETTKRLLLLPVESYHPERNRIRETGNFLGNLKRTASIRRSRLHCMPFQVGDVSAPVYASGSGAILCPPFKLQRLLANRLLMYADYNNYVFPRIHQAVQLLNKTYVNLVFTERIEAIKD